MLDFFSLECAEGKPAVASEFVFAAEARFEEDFSRSLHCIAGDSPVLIVWPENSYC